MIKLETAAPPDSNIPIEAVVLHGHGEAALDHYRRYRAFLAITRAFLALDAAWQSELDGTLIGQGHSILSWVGALPVAAIIEHTETIAFSSWLQELEFRLIQARDREAAERMLAALPLIFLRYLPEIAGTALWQTELLGSARYAPIGLANSIKGIGTIEIEATEDELLLRRSGKIAATLSGGEDEIRIREHALVSAQRRRYLTDNIELYSPLDIPELLSQLSGQEVDFPAADPDAVEANIRGAFDLLQRLWPESVPDLSAVVRGIVAISAPRGTIFSASASGVPGTILLTILPEAAPEVIAECLIHEAAHVKLDTLWASEPLLNNDGERRYRHPWRPDLRPMRGVLLGAHAFINVAEMNRLGVANSIPGPFPQEYRRRRAEVGEAMAVLDSFAEFTSIGQRLHEEMKAVVAIWGPK